MNKPQRTILIADDEEDLRILVEMTLENPLYRIITAQNGLEALESIRQHRPDLAILDWMMPGLTGLQVVQALRQSPLTATLPVVFLTARDRQEDRDAAGTFGLVSYLVKPFSPLELLGLVKKALAE